RYKLALRDLPEMFLVRGLVFSHEAVREWEAKLAPALAGELRRRRRGEAGRSWYVDETYLKVQGADSDETGQAFQSEAGHPFRREAGHPDRRSRVVGNGPADRVSGQAGMVDGSVERRLRKLSPVSSMR